MERITTSDLIYEEIKVKILNKEYLPGLRLGEVKISKELQVSPTPVREAFRRLASEGYLSEIPYKGVVVREYTTEEICEGLMSASELMSLFMSFAIDKSNEKDYFDTLEILENNIRNSQSVYDFIVGNKYFYSRIIELANSDVLQQCFLPIRALVSPELRTFRVKDEDKYIILEMFKDLVLLLELRDKEGIKSINMKITNYLIQIVKKEEQ